MPEETVIINRMAVLDFVLGPTREKTPPPATVVVEETQEEPAEEQTEVRLHPYFVGGLTISTPPGARDIKLATVEVHEKTDEDMRREFEEHEWREEQKRSNVFRVFPSTPPDLGRSHGSVKQWLQRKGVSARTCRRMYMPEMILELRSIGVSLTEGEANKHLRDLEDEEHRERARKIALAHSGC
ncbi:MAG: hypothetical protein AMXMBFR44_6260 [Candidatus Campbellbacteria bacterium]